MALIPPPAPGFYQDVPFAQYADWDCFNNTFSTAMLNGSPATAMHDKLNPKPATPAKKLGAAIHIAVLQPALFESTYIVAGPCAGTTGKGTACKWNGSIQRGKLWYCGQHDPLKGAPLSGDGRIDLSRDDYDICRRMRDGAEKHSLVNQLLKASQIEISACATDGNGIIRKSRLDIRTPELETIWDLKSVDADGGDTEEQFWRSARNYGYDRQASLYLDNEALLGGKCISFAFIAYRKGEPYIPVIYRARESFVEEGRVKISETLKLYQRCRESGTWPHHGWNWDQMDYEIRDIG